MSRTSSSSSCSRALVSVVVLVACLRVCVVGDTYARGLAGSTVNGRLGDSSTSQKSSEAFFGNMDENSDGKIEQREIKKYIHKVGWQTMDEESELARGVKDVLEAIDQNEDTWVDKRDLSDYIAHIASVLTAAEVYDWVRHAVQVPPEVAERFRTQGVTGYDFPELIQDEGNLLENELGVPETWKYKIWRAMKMKLIGVGRPPTTPAPVVAVPNSCHSIGIHWGKRTDESGFPVHKYTLYRLNKSEAWTVNERHTYEGHFSLLYEGNGVSNAINVSFCDACMQLSKLLFVIQDSFLDTHLLGDTSYTYRIFSWNAIGHSEALDLDCRTLECTKQGSNWSFFPIFLSHVHNAVSNIVNLFLFVTSATIVLLRYKSSLESNSHVKRMFGPSFGKFVEYVEWVKRQIHVEARLRPPSLEVKTPADPRNIPLDATRLSSEFVSTSVGVHDTTSCFFCHKKFGFRRLRHNCRDCTISFCCKHGDTHHKFLGSCPVKGSCVCENCSAKRKARKSSTSEPTPRAVGSPLTADAVPAPAASPTAESSDGSGVYRYLKKSFSNRRSLMFRTPSSSSTSSTLSTSSSTT